MPSRPPAACPRPGCPNVKPCPDHPRDAWAEGARGRAMEPGWPAIRAAVLAWAGGRCQLCGLPATAVHHDAAAGLIAICGACHTPITQAQSAQARAARRY